MFGAIVGDILGSALEFEERKFENIGDIDLILPKTINGIYYDTFLDCKSLESIDIPEGVELIGYGSFRGCCKLEQVTIPNSVKKFEDTAFVNCENLSDIYF